MATLDNSTNTCRACKAEKPIGEFYIIKHKSGRQYADNTCKACRGAKNAINTSLRGDAAREWRKLHKRKIRSGAIAADRAVRADRDARRQAERKRIDDRKAQQDAHVRRWVSRQKQIVWQRNERIKPNVILNARMTVNINHALRKKKQGRRWESLVGYSQADLARHLERQFTKGMTWANMGDWHIDHIIPRKAFTFTCAEDDEFKACWALTNLQPLWAADNIAKRASVLTLL